jgi:hypothetical protein
MSALSTIPLAAQQSKPTTEQAPAKALEPMTGEIVSVDTNTKTFAIKTGADSDMKFAYSEETEVVGGEKGPAGLATSAGTLVKVTYDVHGTSNIAIKIEVLPKKN